MKSSDVRRKYIEFFKARGHVEIPSAPLVPENDPTTLFTSSGMQPLVPYLLGQPHPSGKRLVNSQKSFRTQDIEEVGDNRHTTFFEMLGNWSLGEYFKKEQLPWIFEFLTKDLKLDPKRLYVTVFSGKAGSRSAREGNQSVPKDTESIEIWKEIFANVGIEAKEGERIFVYDASKNWWSRSGEPDRMPPGEPGGPDSEVFFDFGQDLKLHEKSRFKDQPCHPNCDCGRFLEIANSVFMQYQKQSDGSLKELSQKNVDFGGGLERLTAATEDNPDMFTIDIFLKARKILEEVTLVHTPESERSIRIILDHLRASMFLIDAGVIPSNKERGYILRRLIRRVALHSKVASIDVSPQLPLLLSTWNDVYRDAYPSLLQNKTTIATTIQEEFERFEKSLLVGMKKIQSLKGVGAISGSIMFDLYQTYGYPPELIKEFAKQTGLSIDEHGFEEAKQKHQQTSRTASAGMFKGGLADQSEQTVKLHTAHHLLLAALQKLVDPTIKQRGSNITAERLRMDVNLGRKITPEELKNVETLVNEKIKENLPVTSVEMLREEAEQIAAQMEFGRKYPDQVSVYFIGPKDDYFSAEFCGGPHASFTGVLGRFTIIKEESAGAGVRRIYATICQNESSRSNQKSSST